MRHIRGRVRPIKSNKDGFAVDCVLGDKLAVPVLELSDLRWVKDANLAVGPIESPLVGLGTVHAQSQTFDVAGWTIDRFIARRTRLHELQYAATRLRERPVIWSVLLLLSANVGVFWVLAHAAAEGRISLGEVVVYVQSALGVSS